MRDLVEDDELAIAYDRLVDRLREGKGGKRQQAEKNPSEASLCSGDGHEDESTIVGPGEAVVIWKTHPVLISGLL